MTALFFPPSTHLKVVCRNIHKLADSEAQLLVVFLVDCFKVFPYSILGVFDIFLHDIEIYSVQYMLLFLQPSCNSDAFD